jgi:hypothetical protein
MLHRGCIHSPPLTNNEEAISETIGESNQYEYRQNVGAHEIVVHDFLSSDPNHFHTFIKTKVICDADGDDHTIYMFPFYSSNNVMFGQHFHAHRSPKEFIHLFIYSFMHLCDGISLLLNGKMVHGNLNLFENILVKNDSPVIADFSLNVSDLFLVPYSASLGSGNSSFIPLELHLMRYLSQHRLQSVSEQNVEDIVYDVYSCHELLDMVAGAEEALVAQAYLMRFVNKSLSEIEAVVLQAAGTWDMYMLCANYWKILKEFSGFKVHAFMPHLELCKKLFRENMRIDPLHRKTVLESKELMKKIFSVYR